MTIDEIVREFEEKYIIETPITIHGKPSGFELSVRLEAEDDCRWIVGWLTTTLEKFEKDMLVTGADLTRATAKATKESTLDEVVEMLEGMMRNDKRLSDGLDEFNLALDQAIQSIKEMK